MIQRPDKDLFLDYQKHLLQKNEIVKNNSSTDMLIKAITVIDRQLCQYQFKKVFAYLTVKSNQVHKVEGHFRIVLRMFSISFIYKNE